MRVGVLGPLLVLDQDGTEVLIPAAKVRAVLTVLALQAGSTVGAAELMEAIWGEYPPRSAAKTLQTYV